MGRREVFGQAWAEELIRRFEAKQLHNFSVLAVAETPTTEQEAAVPEQDDDAMAEQTPQDPAQPTETAAPTAPPEGCPLQEHKQRFQKWTKRVEEESTMMEWLMHAQWVETCPKTEETWDDAVLLERIASEYVQDFDTMHVRMVTEEKPWPRSLRLYVVELTWALQELKTRGKIPKSLFKPQDKAIRGPAAQACGERWEDPGNWRLDTFVQMMRLWEYVCPTGEYFEKVTRLGTGEYGTGSNQSAKGPVNLRGNLAESMLCELQRMGDAPDKNADLWKGSWPWNETGWPHTAGHDWHSKAA